MGKTGVGKSSLCNALFAGDIAIVVIVIILNKTGVSDSLTALTLATVAALLTGGGAAGAASVALTPFVGVPVGIFVGIYVFAKVVRLISGKK
ncbi:hypothetical protein VRM73_004673 [Enterobacter hormaechei]|nr:hypothetical protein [Enterobacter hormaechei]